MFEPHLLILDEPTNHLDFAGIHWLEEFLKKGEFAVLFVSHDRAFLRSLSTRILELDRGKSTSWTCGYEKIPHSESGVFGNGRKEQCRIR